jgi:hypothetical protein
VGKGRAKEKAKEWVTARTRSAMPATGKNGLARSADARGERLPRSRNGREAGSTPVCLFVIGGAGVAPDDASALRDCPLINRTNGESRVAHLKRVATLLDAAIADGGTHLVVPPEHTAWLRDHPLVATLLDRHHTPLETGAKTGTVFALTPPAPVSLDLAVEGWQTAPGPGISLVAGGRLVAPALTLRPAAPARGILRGRLTLAGRDIRTLRLVFVLTRPDRRRGQRREVVLSLIRPGAVFHTLPFFAAVRRPDGSLALDFDLDLRRARDLDRIEVEVVEEDNWRLHPNFPGGASFALPAAVPAGARLALRDLTLTPAPSLRRAPRHGSVDAPRPAPYRKPRGRPRDAVIFSSWVPREGLALGDAFIETLVRWHADSKIFVGVNHGSSPRWTARLRQSGLDVTIRHASPTMTMPFDPTGFVAALDAFRRSDEVFDLVWFGHNKGGDHLDDPNYATARWTIERMFWSRRAEIARYFDDPVIGLYAPHYLMMLQEHLTQTEALLRMYQAVCSPLYLMSVATHFVMRDESVRDFCARVDPRFFRYGPEPFGGDRYFFEMAMPNVPIMQGYEPYIEPGLGGTKGPPKIDGVASILSDWKQNQAVVAIELEKWRQQPTHFRTRHREHLTVD